MVLNVEVSIPENVVDKNVRSDCVSVPEVVVDLGDFTVGMLEVTEIVHYRITCQYRAPPPESKIQESLLVLSKCKDNQDIHQDLAPSPGLELAHDAALLAIGPIFEAPSSATVVNGDTKSRVDDSSDAALEG